MADVPSFLIPWPPRRFRAAAAALAFCAARAAVADAPPEVARGAAPEWVAWLTPDLAPATEREQAEAGGAYALLLDLQTDVATETQFVHEAVLLLNAAGLEQRSRLLIVHDPSYQRIALHRLWIHRDGRRIELTERQPIRLREREPNLERNLYDGTVTLEALLEDLRPGDILEYAYSIRGRNPIFGGRYADSFGLSATVPVRRWRTLIRLPEDRAEAFAVKTFNGADRLLVREGRTLRADQREVRATRLVADAPAWFFPYPRFEVSEFADWAAVVEWALPLYRAEGPLPDELRPALDILRRTDDPDERLREALRFVSESVRYVAVATGIHSHAPYPLADVARRRFGDCKDKAILLVALLRAAGIEAWPALVNTECRHTIAESLPSPIVFNHVIVAARATDGRTVWVDPTVSYQRGPPDRRFMPAYGWALPIRDGAAALDPVPGAGADASAVDVIERFVLPEREGDPVRLEVRTTFTGLEADQMRAQLAATPAREIQDRYRDYYARRFNAVEAQRPLEVRDDEAANRIEVEERWLLADPWKADPETGRPGLFFEPLFADRLHERPGASAIERPLRLSYPVRIRHLIKVELPFEMSLPSEQNRAKTDHWRFAFNTMPVGRTYSILYHYQTFRDHVPARDLAEHRRALEKASATLTHMIFNPWRFRAGER